MTPTTGPPDDIKSEASIDPAIEDYKRSTLNAVILVSTCTFAMIVNTSNNTSVSISLARIGKDLHVQEARLQWLLSAYSLSGGCLLIVFGRVADLYGRKKMFSFGSLLLAAVTLGCGFVKDFNTLIILRGIQGVGAAASMPASLGILARAFPPSPARSIAFATFAAGAPIGGAFGSVFGGLLAQTSGPSWRSSFYLSCGLTILCFIGGFVSFDPDVPSTEPDRRIDWFGAFLITAGLVFIVTVLGQGEIAPQKWRTPYIIILLVVGVILVIFFFLWQRYLEKVQNTFNAPYSFLTPPPLMKPSMWTRAKGRFAVMMFVAFLTWCSFLSWAFWVQLYYQDFIGYSPIRTTVRLVPMFISGVICNIVVASIVGRVPMIYLLVIGTFGTSTACLFFALIDPSAPYWAFGFPAAILSVIGGDFVFSSGTLFIAKISLEHEQSLGGALFQTMTQLGTAFGATVTTVVFNRVTLHNSTLTGNSRPALNSYRSAQWAAFAFGVSAAILAILFFRGVGIVGHQKNSVPSEQDDRVNTEP